MSIRKMRNYVNGEWTESNSSKVVDVVNPATDEVLAQLPLTTKDETEEAVKAAQDAFWEWRCTPPLERARFLMKLKHLMDAHHDETARVLTQEHGKTLKEAWTELERAIENVEVATGVTSMMMGDVLEDVARGIDEYAIRQPLGVCASINPFNFPGMIPFWSLPYALATGNTMIVKSSSRVPMTMEKVFELVDEVGFPKGVVNLIGGSRDVSDALLDSSLVKAISFVGSTKIGQYVYNKCAQTNKRAQVQTSANNFGIVMPDAVFDKVVPNIVASAYDCTGQRCLALAAILAVGDAYGEVKKRVVAAAKKLRVGYGLDEGVDIGPVITKEAKANIEGWIEKGVEEGAKLILDGRGIVVQDYPNGYWLGPSIFDECSRDMEVANEEIFGPVLCIIRIKDLDEGLDIINANRYGNAATIYTQNGAWAREFKYRARSGNLGINIGVAAPMAFFHFAGCKDSFFGVLHVQGRNAFEFFTDSAVVVERWY